MNTIPTPDSLRLLVDAHDTAARQHLLLRVADAVKRNAEGVLRGCRLEVDLDQGMCEEPIKRAVEYVRTRLREQGWATSRFDVRRVRDVLRVAFMINPAPVCEGPSK